MVSPVTWLVPPRSGAPFTHDPEAAERAASTPITTVPSAVVSASPSTPAAPAAVCAIGAAPSGSAPVIAYYVFAVMPGASPRASVAFGKPTFWLAHGPRVAVMGFTGDLPATVAMAVLALQVHWAVAAAAGLAAATSPATSTAQTTTRVIPMRCIPQPLDVRPPFPPSRPVLNRRAALITRKTVHHHRFRGQTSSK
jgi:hypothetical protein